VVYGTLVRSVLLAAAEDKKTNTHLSDCEA